MRLLNISNQNFYILMVIVIGILVFIEFRESMVNVSNRNDKIACQILILFYAFITLSIWILNAFI